jgi:predicted Zn finger-like uncharacterized protein
MKAARSGEGEVRSKGQAVFMKVTCQSCQAKYTIADEKVRGKVAKIRCKKCGTTILVDGTDGSGASSDAPVSTAPVVPDSMPLAPEPVVSSAPEPAKPFVAPAPEAVALRRPGRAASTDLFGAARQDDAITSAASPALPHLPTETSAEKLTGARNENSVLFSLSALTGSPTPAVPGPDSMPSSRTADLRSLIGTTSSSSSSKDKSKLDDIMNLGGGGLYSPALISPALAPPPLELSVSAQESSGTAKSKGRIIGIVAAVAVVGVAVTAFAVMKGDKAAPTTASSASTLTSASAVAAEPLPTPSATEPAASVAAAEPSASASAAQAAAEAPTALAPGQAPPPKPEVEKKPTPMVAAAPRPAAERVEKVEKPAEKPTAAPAPPPPAVTQAALQGTASGEFDRAAAMSILSNVALQSQACKKSDGPTGSGKVAVTYASSGLATTAVVEGPPFAGTAVGGCVAQRFRATRVPPFNGSPFTVRKSFFIQ